VRLRIAVVLAALTVTQLSAQPLGIRTLAGSTNGGGLADGFGVFSRFSVPRAIAADAAGNLWVADTGNHVIRRITPAGDVVTIAGDPGVQGFADGSGSAARFRYPAGIAVDPVTGEIWISDKDNQVIRRMTPTGTVTTIAGEPGVAGSADAQGTAAKFAYPRGLIVDNSGIAYVADTQNQAIRRVTADGIVTTFAGKLLAVGSTDGVGGEARFRTPSDIARDPTTGNFYVTDTGNSRLRAITPDGTVTTFAGNNTSATFRSAWGIDADAAGNLYVADHDHHMLRRITPERVVTILSANDFHHPSGVAFAPDGAVYLTDAFNHAIRRIALPDGAVTTLAGSMPSSEWGNGTGIAARFLLPYAVTSDPAGNVYVGESGSIRKITPGGVTTTLGTSFGDVTGIAYGPDGNLYVAAVQIGAVLRVTTSGVVTTIADQDDGLGFVWGIAVDNLLNLYVTDFSNNKIHLISSDGMVSTLAGTGSAGLLDGPAATSRFDSPTGIALDAARNVYVADWRNSAIRKISFATGMVSTIVVPSAGMFRPNGIASDAAGNVYVSDSNHVIFRVTNSGVITTVAGLNGTPGNVNGTGARARFAYPEGLALMNTGELLIADSFNHAIRIGTPVHLARRRGIN
jgi:sugar lactone lactonase YvrE